MRRLKMVVYLLILGILSSLLGNVSFAWASTQDKLTITEIYDLDLLSAPLMCPVGSDSFDEIIQAYSDCPLYAVCENENESTELIPSYDTRSVDVQKEGIYEMTKKCSNCQRTIRKPIRFRSVSLTRKSSKFFQPLHLSTTQR